MTACRWCGGDTDRPGHDQTVRHQIWAVHRAGAVPVMSDETPIYDQLLSEEAPPILRRGWLIPGIPYWQCWDEVAMWLPPREADPTPRIRRIGHGTEIERFA